MNAARPGNAAAAGGVFNRRRKLVGFVIGALLFAAAIGAIVTNHQHLQAAWRHGTGDRWPLLLLAIVLPMGNWVVTSAALWALMRPRRDGDGVVGFIEMLQLVGVAGLANFLPMRPGMFGRLAYHKVVNGIPVSRALWATFAKLALSAGAIAMVVGVGLIAAAWAVESAVVLGLMLLAPAAVLLVSATAFKGTPRARIARSLLLGGGFSLCDIVIWCARYAVLFTLVGVPLNAPQAAAVAGVSQAAMVVPLTGNGLGLREWAVGMTGSLLPESFTGAAPVEKSAALSADVLNRGIEVVVAVGLGAVCSGLIAARLRRRGIKPESLRGAAAGDHPPQGGDDGPEPTA